MRTSEELARASEAYRREMDAILAEEAARATVSLHGSPRSSEDLDRRKHEAQVRYNRAVGAMDYSHEKETGKR